MCDLQFIHSGHWLLNWFELYIFDLMLDLLTLLAQACIGHVAIPSFIRQATWTLVRANGKDWLLGLRWGWVAKPKTSWNGIFSGDGLG